MSKLSNKNDLVLVPKNLKYSADQLVNHIMNKFNLTDYNELSCPLMKNLANSLNSTQELNQDVNLIEENNNLRDALNDLLQLIESERPDWKHEEQLKAEQLLKKVRS